MRLYYRGVSYEYYSSQAESSSQFTAQPMQVLQYRGTLYIRREHRLLNLRRIRNKATHLSEVSQDSHTASPQQIGFLHKLYCIGWHNGSLQSYSPLQHRLLSSLILYRTGYAAGFKWRQHNLESRYRENN
jgi:hypothetical protein